MSRDIEIIFIDINNIIEEEKEKDDEKKKEDDKNDEEKKDASKKKKTLLNKIIDHFLDNHILLDLENEEYEQYYEYSFIYQIYKGITKQFKFYLFTKLKQESFSIDSNGLFILCDLTNNKTKELLEKIIENIKKICPDIRLYILGIIKSKKEGVLTEELITKMFKEEEITLIYKEIDFNNLNNDNEEDNKKDNKINNNTDNNNMINNDNKNIKNENNIINENNKDINDGKKNDELNKEGEIEERVYEKIDKFIEHTMLDIYNNKKLIIPSINKNELEKGLGENTSHCFIY